MLPDPPIVDMGTDGIAANATTSTGRTLVSSVTVEYEYFYTGDQLTMMTRNGEQLWFYYDAAGIPYALKYQGNYYYYSTNLQGDVEAIRNTSGTTVVQYTYDAWGNLVRYGGSLFSTLGQINPLRYRGYVYDTETGLYYLQSRYYNPELGRFINADAFVSTGQGMLGNNMFAYCNNNPVNRHDPSGNMVDTIAYGPRPDPLAEFIKRYGGGGGSAGAIGGLVVTVILVGHISEVIEKEDITSLTATGDNESKRIYTVYYLYAAGDDSRKIIYVGRVLTANFDSRMAYHRSQGRYPCKRVDGLTYDECRGLEQASMIACHTLNSGNPLGNKIRGVGPLNNNRFVYFSAIQVCAQINPELGLSYLLNWTENEFLNGGL